MSTATITPFLPDKETIQEFLQRFKVQNSEKLNHADTSAREKAAILVRALPVHVVTDIQRKIVPTELTNATYDDIERNLISQYDVKKSVIGAAVKFINRKQQQGESIEKYAQCLNTLATPCNYRTCCRDRLLRDIFVSGLNSGNLISTLLQECEDKTFAECIERAKTLEQLASDAADLKPQFSTYKIDNRQENRQSTLHDKYVCIRCGSRAKHLASCLLYTSDAADE